MNDIIPHCHQADHAGMGAHFHYIDHQFVEVESDDTPFPRQTCPMCRAEHPGQTCPLEQDSLW